MISKEIKRCICSGTDSAVLFTSGSHSICRCVSCGQVYVSGIDIDVIKEVYNEKQYFAERNAYIVRWDEFSRLFQKIIDKIIKFKPQGRLLDVGCSVGILLDVARKNGFDVKGVEVSTWASEFARQKGFDVITGGLLEAAYPEKSFDIVVLNHVLEHIPKPVVILFEAKRILKDDGLLVIGVPNFGSYMAAIKKGKWASLQPDQHIWQFTHESLLRVLMKTGFSEVYFEAKENHRLNWMRPDSIIFFLVNTFALLRNNAEAMLFFARKSQ
jgi:2-polyprenyl-3-methyl-5-hydroxy-6-metoxy-1,4-benzoquinol methylase